MFNFKAQVWFTADSANFRLFKQLTTRRVVLQLAGRTSDGHKLHIFVRVQQHSNQIGHRRHFRAFYADAVCIGVRDRRKRAAVRANVQFVGGFDGRSVGEHRLVIGA